LRDVWGFRAPGGACEQGVRPYFPFPCGLWGGVSMGGQHGYAKGSQRAAQTATPLRGPRPVLRRCTPRRLSRLDASGTSRSSCRERRTSSASCAWMNSMNNRAAVLFERSVKRDPSQQL
jgi:hypothetical protein